MKIMKVLRWPLEFIAVIVVGMLFTAFMNAISGDFDSDFGLNLLEISYILLYIAGVIWIAALRIVRTIKKGKDEPKVLPQ